MSAMRKLIVVLVIAVISLAMTGCWVGDPVRGAEAEATALASSRDNEFKIAQATSNAEVQATAETQSRHTTATWDAVKLQTEMDIRRATQDAVDADRRATDRAREFGDQVTRQVVDAKLTAIPANIKTQMETENANRWLWVLGLGFALLIATGVGYYMVQLTQTQSSVAHVGPTGITVRRGNTFQAMPRTIGAVTITPPGAGARLRNLVLELRGKHPEPLFDRITQHDKGATALQYAQIAAGDLIASAKIGAAKAQQLNIPKGAAGRDLHITQALPMPGARPTEQLSGADILNLPSCNRGGEWQLTTDVLHRLGLEAPKGDVVDADVNRVTASESE